MKTKVKDKECPRCKGRGYTDRESPTVKQVSKKKWKVTELGSGCTQCLGLGYLIKEIEI